MGVALLRRARTEPFIARSRPKPRLEKHKCEQTHRKSSSGKKHSEPGNAASSQTHRFGSETLLHSGPRRQHASFVENVLGSRTSDRWNELSVVLRVSALGITVRHESSEATLAPAERTDACPRVRRESLRGCLEERRDRLAR